jgi:hypothetical protein
VTPKGKGAAGGLVIGLSESFVRLFTIEMTSEQILGKWRYFITPIHRIKK